MKKPVKVEIFKIKPGDDTKCFVVDGNGEPINLKISTTTLILEPKGKA